MIRIAIPGRGDVHIENIVFDVNGTIARDGFIEESIKRKLAALTELATVFLLTADTYGMIEREMGGNDIAIHKIAPSDEDTQKEAFVTKLGAQKTIAIGNGENDARMLKAAVLGICVVAEEGASARAVENADIVVYGRETAFGLLENPKRIVATLRR